MTNKSPIFPMPGSQHFGDYGFDPQIDYFQVLEGARKHKKETSSRSIGSLHFKLQKPISKDEANKVKKTQNKAKKKRWWRNALLFFKWKWIHNNHNHGENDLEYNVHHARARAFGASISAPVYTTESRSWPSTPYRSTRRPSSGPLAGTLTRMSKGDVLIPYMNLRELNMEQQRQQQRLSSSFLPIYLVT